MDKVIHIWSGLAEKVSAIAAETGLSSEKIVELSILEFDPATSPRLLKLKESMQKKGNAISDELAKNCRVVGNENVV